MRGTGGLEAISGLEATYGRCHSGLVAASETGARLSNVRWYKRRCEAQRLRKNPNPRWPSMGVKLP